MAQDEIEDGVVLDEEGKELSTVDVGDTDDHDEDDAPVKQEAETQDEEGHADESEEDAEARRIRNRQRRQENKERRKDYVESLKRELAARDELLAQQEARLAAVERRTHGADVAAVDAELKKSVDAYNYFKSQMADATNRADGAMAVEAQERMMQAADRAKQLAAIKQASSRPAQTQAPLDPRLKMQAEKWLDRNEWYDPAIKDTDSRIAKSVDEALHQEGWNPNTEQYWEELDSRLKKYLPHRYNQGYNKPSTKPRVPVAGSSRDNGGGTTGYRLSAERVNALKESGIWDDPKQRAEAVKRYQEFDKQQSA